MLTDKMIGNKPGAVMNIEYAQVDDIALKVLKRDAPDFLLPLNVINIDGEYELRYELVGNRLSYLQGKMMKKDYIVLLKNILLPYKACVDWFLDYHNLHLDKHYMMCDKNTYDIRFLYIPSKEIIHSDEEINQFLQNFLVNVEVEDDSSYPMKLLRILMSEKANPMELLEVILKQEAEMRPAVNNVAPAEEAKNESDFINQGVEKIAKLVDGAVNLTEDLIKKDTQKNLDKIGEKESGNKEKSVPGFLGGIGKNHTKTQKNQEAEKPLSKDQSGMAARPGVEFGKVEVGADIMGNLFGESPAKVEESAEKKKQKATKQTKPAKKEKEVKEGGLFGGLFGNKKTEKHPPNEKSNPKPANTEEEELRYLQEPVGIPNPSFSFVDEYGSEGYTEEDETVVFDDEGRSCDDFVRFKLEDGGGFHVPALLEIDLRKGYATVGRKDKSGREQCDYNFEPSISLVSRMHFRLEKKENQIYIIDLNSSNGTFVNGSPIVANIPQPVYQGDLISVSSRRRITYKML